MSGPHKGDAPKTNFNVFDGGSTLSAATKGRNQLIQSTLGNSSTASGFNAYNNVLSGAQRLFSSFSGFQAGYERYNNSQTQTQTGRIASSVFSGVLSAKISPVKLVADNVVGQISHRTGFMQNHLQGRTPSQWLSDQVDQRIQSVESHSNN